MNCLNCGNILDNTGVCRSCGARHIIRNNRLEIVGIQQTLVQANQSSQNAVQQNNVLQRASQSSVRSDLERQDINKKEEYISKEAKKKQIKKELEDIEEQEELEATKKDRKLLVDETEKIVRKYDTYRQKILLTDKRLYVEGNFYFRDYDNNLRKEYRSDIILLDYIYGVGKETVGRFDTALENLLTCLYFTLAFMLSAIAFFLIQFRGIGNILRKASKDMGVTSTINKTVDSVSGEAILRVLLLSLITLCVIFLIHFIYRKLRRTFSYIAYSDLKLYYRPRNNLLNKDIIAQKDEQEQNRV